eukprot:g30828.t1
MKRDHSTRRTALRPRGFVCFFFGTAWHKPLEEVEVRRRRSVRDVVSHFEKTQIANRSDRVGLASSSSLDRLVPASLLEEDKSISYERGHAAADASHEAGKCTLPGLTERASREEGFE